MIERLPLIVRALWYGQKLRRSADIKDWAASAAVFAPVLLWAFPWLQARGYLPLDLTVEEAQSLAMQLATALLVAAGYFFRATSDQVGFGSREAKEPLPPPEASGAPAGEPPVDYERAGGVLYRYRPNEVQARGGPGAHPGDDPDLGSFNRG